jgi:hypothetical protein
MTFFVFDEKNSDHFKPDKGAQYLRILQKSKEQA